MRTLPDYLRKGMKLVIVGCNPSESSVRVGHYYAGRVNQFWPVLYKGGVVPEPFDYHDDKRVIEFGIGLTDLVKRPTKTTAELTREDFAEGRIVLSQRLGEFTPHVIAFNGKLAFEQFAQRKCRIWPSERSSVRRARVCFAGDEYAGSPWQQRACAPFSEVSAAGLAHRDGASFKGKLGS